MPRADANGIELEYETFGAADKPTVLLIMGLGGQLTAWDDGFCRALADRGFRVVRYDNRDVGLSTRIEGGGEPDILAAMTTALNGGRPAVPYTLEDMADDAIGLLDVLGARAAHVVGISMGGMIAQVLAIRHPARVLSLCSIMSMTGDHSVGLPTPDAMSALMMSPPRDRDEAIEQAVAAQRVVGSPGFPFDEDRVRERAVAAYDRAHYPAGITRQLAAVIAAEDRTAALAGVSVPTVVIHGSDDPLVTPAGGEATAKAVPGAELVMVPGMGHELPEAAWPVVVDAIVANIERAARGSEAPPR